MALAPRYRLFGWVAAAVVVLDQATKAAVIATMPLGSSRPVIEGFFDLVHVANRGAAFGFLNRADIDWQNGFFIAAALAALVLLAFLVRTSGEHEKLVVGSFGLVAGGAAGNLIDRLRFAHVTDFLDLYIGQYHWPAFNVADSAISVGAVLIVLAMLRKPAHAPGSH